MSSSAEPRPYLGALGALQNVAKYARASHTVVHIGQDDAMLAFRIPVYAEAS